MGICSSSIDEDEREAIEQSKKIDKENARDYRAEAEKIKILLLGAGDSGKSTIFKQMRLLYGEAYTEDEKMSFRLFIRQNAVEAIGQLCLAVLEQHPDDPIVQTDSFKILCPPDFSRDQFRKFPELSPEYVAAIKSVWRSPAIERAWADRSRLQITDTAALFLDRVEEIATEEYIPSESDIVLARIRTTGIREERLKIDDQIFQFFDVGGQRNERRKWIHCFEGVHGVMFVAALSEYDQTLFEENSVNRMTEALDLFEQTVNESAFVHSAMILFLNKSDLYEEKIKHVPISSIPDFSDYSGTPCNRDEGIAYFVGKFMERNSTHQEVFQHVTCATDQTSVMVVFNACKSVIIRSTLENTGFVS
mmetsp:Transcript_20393/g.29289  ORF Transcript_20393/g.29289 Transcript_20393/m.29289 type:complete len:363 (-) Transcript_20393:204-1292(-)